ncbi:MAG: PilZ domain-containing protein [bacterium]
MVQYHGPERRSFTRLPISLQVDFLLFDTQDSKELTDRMGAHARNISAGGLLIETSRIPVEWMNALISGKITFVLEFKIPGSENPIRTSARVSWMARRKEEEAVEPFVMGLNFTEITPEDQERIIQFVSNAPQK